MQKLSIQERIKKMQEDQKKKNEREKEKIKISSGSIQDRIKKMQEDQNKKNEKNEKEQIEINSTSIQDRIKKMQEGQNKKEENENPISTIHIQEKAKKNNKDEKTTKKEKEPEEVPKSKIIPGSEIILEENEKVKIYKYPNIKFSKTDDNNSKILVMLGKEQNLFINTFINIYSNISFNDDIRYSIDLKEKKGFNIYNIKSRTKPKNHDIKMICIPNLDMENNTFSEQLIEIFKDIPRNKIHLILFTLDENIDLNENEKIFYKLLINFLNCRSKLLFLIQSCNDNNNNQNCMIHNFLNFEIVDYFYTDDSNIKPEYFFINNKIIFENDEKCWKNAKEQIQKIINKISSSKGEQISIEIISFMDKLFFSFDKLLALEEKDKFLQKYIKTEKKLQLMIINYLLIRLDQEKSNKKNDISRLILFLFNRANKEIYNLNDNKMAFMNDENAYKSLVILSRLCFQNLESLTINNCKINDDYASKFIRKLFSPRLKNLNLSNNNISDLSFFNEIQDYSNLEILDLSNNNIVNIIPLLNCGLYNLINLNLSNNKISSIDCFGEKSKDLRNLKFLDLSNNSIKSLSNIDIKTLENLNLLNNELKSGIEQFLSNFENMSKELILEVIYKNNKCEILFNYSIKLELKFTYIVENGNINNSLGNVPFNGIQKLTLKNFNNNNMDFLSNNTLKDLKKIDLRYITINDLSMFNKIHFVKLENISLDSGDIIEKGIHSLNAFKLIEVYKLSIDFIENKYKCCANFINPYLNLCFYNIDFLSDELFYNMYYLIISNIQFDIDGHSTNLFSYESLKNYKLAFARYFKAENINIEYKDNKYVLDIDFNSPMKIDYNQNKYESNHFNLSFNFNDLSFLKNDDILKCAKSIILNNITFDNSNIDSLESLKSYSELESLTLKNIYIENGEFDILKYNNFTIDSYNCKINPNLIESLNGYFFEGIYENGSLILKYDKPFVFNIITNKDILTNFQAIKNCYSMTLKYLNLKDNDLSFINSLSNVKYLDLSYTGIQNLNFLSYNSLSNLQDLNLNNNKIEDISYLIEDNINCKKLEYLRLLNNPIRRGYNVLKENFFTNKTIYILIDNINKINEEYQISLNYEKFNSHIYIDIYINDLINIRNLIEYEYCFFNRKINIDDLKELKISKEEFTEKEQNLEYLELIKNKNNIFASINIYSDDRAKYITNLFKLLINKGYNFLKEYSQLDLLLNLDKIKYYFSFLDLNTLIDYEFKELETIDLSNIKLTDIKILCNDVPLENLRILKICNNPDIKNLNELKNAKFIFLYELFLSNNGISDLNEIEMEKYPFTYLEVLDLSRNRISNINPILHFKNLKSINLSYNLINQENRLTLKDAMNKDTSINLKFQYNN